MDNQFFSYKLDHDYGLAPNPFGQYCTLAVCKPRIRRNKSLKLGDWIFGTGSAKLNNPNRLIYAMVVEERITFEQYWKDSRFQYKKPVLNGSLVQIHGDNIYHKDPMTGDWIQENSAHSKHNGVLNSGHLDTDIGGNFVLISEKFYYFGNNAIEVPKPFSKIICASRDFCSKSIPNEIANAFVSWLQDNYKTGIHGNPISWTEYRKEIRRKLP